MNVPLNTVIAEGLYSALPAFGMAGRIYFATDTKDVWYDTGTAWTKVTPRIAPTNVALTPSAPGNFTQAHGLGVAPVAVLVSMTSGGQIWLQSPTGFDGFDLYLVASEAGVTGNAVCFV